MHSRLESSGGTPDGGRVAHVRRRHGPPEPRADDGVPVVAWRPASDAPPAGSADLDNTAGSGDAPGTRSRTLYADRCGGRDADHWHHGIGSVYLGDVPRESKLPTDRPRDSTKSLGHLCFRGEPSTRSRKPPLNLAEWRAAAHDSLQALASTQNTYAASSFVRAQTQIGGRRQGRRPSRKFSPPKEKQVDGQEDGEVDGEVDDGALLPNTLEALTFTPPVPENDYVVRTR